MTETPNHTYNVPDRGVEDWHRPLNENFEQLDTDVAIRDAGANRGDYDPTAGTAFEATDSGAVYYGTGSDWRLADRELNALRVQEQVVGETVTPPPDANLATFIPEHTGQVIDLAGREYRLSETLVLPDNIVIANGQIRDDPDVDIQSFDNKDMIITPRGENSHDLYFRNVTIGPASHAISGLVLHQPRNLELHECAIKGYRFGRSLALLGDNTSQNESLGPLIANCWFKDAFVQIGEPLPRDPRQSIDYVNITGCVFGNRSTIDINGENNTIGGGTHISATAGSTAVTVRGNKTHIENTMIHHSGTSVKAVDVGRLQIDGLHVMICDPHAVHLDGVRNSELSNVFVGRAADDGIRLSATNRSCEKNHVHGCNLEVYQPEKATTTNPIHEADPAASNNKIRGNAAGNASGDWRLNSGDVSGNSPRVTWDDPPETPEQFRQIVATGAWDPDDDGNGELVLYDGSEWVEVADLAGAI